MKKRILSVLTMLVMAVSLFGVLPSITASAVIGQASIKFHIKEGYVMTYRKLINGKSAKYFYDSNGNKILYQCSNGSWEKYTYDSDGHELSYEDSDGRWRKSTYNSNGNNISYETSEGVLKTNTYTYHSNGEIETQLEEYSDGVWCKHVYDSNGNNIYSEDSYGNCEEARYVKIDSEEFKNYIYNTPSDNIPSDNKKTSSSTQQTKKPTTKATRNANQVLKDKMAAKKAMKQAKLTSHKVRSKSRKKISVVWKKVKKAKGYQVQVSTNKKFKKSKIIFKKDVKKTKLKIKNKKIKSKKKYFVRVRAYAEYKDINNKSVRVYSKWNRKLRKVKVK